MSPSSGASVARGGWRGALPTPRQMLWGVLGAFVLLVVLVAIGYALTKIPNPSSFATQQVTHLLYSDGSEMARLGATNRTDVPLSRVPKDVQNAVLAAEDREFYSEPGISPTGILRALWTDITGGDISQGGSTITQQYVKNAYLTQARTFTRKFKEIFIAAKLGNSRSKDQILADYLNTIYFGRGAYGIGAAARAYFGTDVSKLDASQGAVLAGLITAPSAYDPAVNASAAHDRWQYVIDGMVKKHWLSQDQAAKLRFPKVRSPRSTSSGCSGDIGFICQAVRADLTRHGFDQPRLDAGGYRVVTTISRKAQQSAEQAMADNHGAFQRSGVDRGREAALVSVQPGDGAIRAMYGGDDFCRHKHKDDCTDLTGVSSMYGRPPGSSFKPYTLVTALQQGIGLDSIFNGPPSVDVNGTTIHNSQNETCPHCTLTVALARSINTIFVPLAQQVGPDKVVQTAHDAGIPDSVKLGPFPGISLGPDDVSPLDQAVGYATIAAQGVRAQPYLVAAVKSQSGQVVYRAQKQTERVFPADVMADATYAMTQVLDDPQGTAAGHQLTGRPAAGKTGTNGEESGNRDAWFIGFTPQLSTAVWYGNTDRKKQVTDNGAAVYGGGLPAATWQEMMNGALAGEPVESFPPPAHVGGNINSPSPSATPTSASPTGSPTTSPTPTTLSPTPITTSPSPTTTSPTPTPTLTSPTPTKSSKSPGPGGGGGGGGPSP